MEAVENIEVIKLKERVGSLAEKIDKLEKKVEILDIRVDKFDRYMEKIDVTLEFMSEKIESVDKSLSKFIEKYEQGEKDRQTERDNKRTQDSSKDMKEITLTVLKYLGVIIAAAAAGKLF